MLWWTSSSFSSSVVVAKVCFEFKQVLSWGTKQRSKLTFSKSRLLATFNYKMVAIKKKSVAPKKIEGEETSWHITRRANAPNSTFSTLRFATVRERERRDCLVAKTIYFIITKLLRPGNIANGAQSPIERHFELHFILSLRIRLSEWREGNREGQVMPLLVLLIKFALFLINFQVSFSFNLLVANWRLSPEFRRQIFFPLAMATKLGTAWSAATCRCGLFLSYLF